MRPVPEGRSRPSMHPSLPWVLEYSRTGPTGGTTTIRGRATSDLVVWGFLTLFCGASAALLWIWFGGVGPAIVPLLAIPYLVLLLGRSYRTRFQLVLNAGNASVLVRGPGRLGARSFALDQVGLAVAPVTHVLWNRPPHEQFMVVAQVPDAVLPVSLHDREDQAMAAASALATELGLQLGPPAARVFSVSVLRDRSV